MKLNDLIRLLEEKKSTIDTTDKRRRLEYRQLSMVQSDIQYCIENGYNPEIDLNGSSRNLGVIAQIVAIALVKVFTEKTEKKTEINRTNYQSNNYLFSHNKVVSCIKSESSEIKAYEPSDNIYCYYVKAKFHGIVRFKTNDITFNRLKEEDITKGKIIYQW